jgi:hypothetical protein
VSLDVRSQQSDERQNQIIRDAYADWQRATRPGGPLGFLGIVLPDKDPNRNVFQRFFDYISIDNLNDSNPLKIILQKIVSIYKKYSDFIGKKVKGYPRLSKCIILIMLTAIWYSKTKFGRETVIFVIFTSIFSISVIIKRDLDFYREHGHFPP